MRWLGKLNPTNRKKLMNNENMNEESMPDVEVPETGVKENGVGEEIENLRAQLVEAQRQLTETQEQLVRSLADFQNFRKRKIQDEAQIRQFATERFVTDLLPVLDNFERTVAHLQQGASAETMIGGIQAVARQLQQVIESQNVKRIESVGQPFDPNVHEAIAMVEPEEGQQPDTVVLEVEAGYKMGERVIRPARVKVASA